MTKIIECALSSLSLYVVVGVSFTEAVYEVSEGRMAEVCLLLDQDLRREITITLETTDGTALGASFCYHIDCNS